MKTEDAVIILLLFCTVVMPYMSIPALIMYSYSKTPLNAMKTSTTGELNADVGHSARAVGRKLRYMYLCPIFSIHNYI